MILHLGVTDVAYSNANKGGASSATTTGQVAEILEAEYDVMHVFYNKYEKEIAEQISQRLKVLLEARQQGGDSSVAMREIFLPKTETAFKKYLDMREWRGVTGRVIMAAVMGTAHSKADKKRATSRPEFIDTGLYQQSMKAWLTK